MQAVFTVDGDLATPSEHAAGPWDATMQHGAAPSTLITWAAERVPVAAPMMVARVTVDLLRPVPVAPLTIHTAVAREGRKIQLCHVSLRHDGTEVARGSVLKVRRAAQPLPPSAAPPPLDVPLPTTGERFGRHRVGFAATVSISPARGGMGALGPSAVWFRLEHPLIAGEATTPLLRAVATADFSNGVSAPLDFGAWTFLNADLNVFLAREPVGEWILLDGESWIGPDGRGVASSRLADAHGYFGRAVQTLVIEQRG